MLYNPSTWAQRAPIIVLGLIGYFLSRPMAGFQLGHVDSVWEPFLADGTRKILTSHVSKAWPVSDAGLGTMAYLVEVLSTFMGDKRRWRTMPWMVALFGFAVIPLGITSIILIVMQPIAVGAWCTLCLATGAAMLVMLPLALAPGAAQWNSAAAGILLMVLSLPLGRIRDHYGTFDPYVVWPRGLLGWAGSESSR